MINHSMTTNIVWANDSTTTYIYMYIYTYIGYFDYNKRIIIEPVLRHLGMLVAPWFDRDCQETNRTMGWIGIKYISLLNWW